MIVHLGVIGPARPVGESGCDDAGDVLFDDAVRAGAGAKHLPLRIGEDVPDGLEMAVVDDQLRLLIAEGPGDRDRLRGRERQIEAGDGCSSGRSLRRQADRLAGDRVGQGDEHETEVFRGHLRARLQPPAAVEVCQTLTEKSPGRRARLGVVASERGGLLSGAVAGGDGLHEVAKPASEADAANRNHANAKLVFHALLSRDASNSRIHLVAQHSRRRLSPAVENDRVSSKDDRSAQT